MTSMHWKGPQLPPMERYLLTNVHLQHFTFTFVPESGSDDHFGVPTSFLQSLRRNGSLHSVKFKNASGHLHQLDDYTARLVTAFTTRNRELSNVMKTSLAPANTGADTSDTIVTDNDAVSAARKKCFPMLCQASQQAPATAHNGMLRGLLASLDTLGTKNGGLQGKRSGAAASLEDRCDHRKSCRVS